MRAERHDPTAHSPAVQWHSHAIADHDTLQQRVGDEVVELLVESGDIGNDPRHQTLRTEVREGHAPTAAMNCSRRLRCSQVNSGRLRPK